MGRRSSACWVVLLLAVVAVPAWGGEPAPAPTPVSGGGLLAPLSGGGAVELPALDPGVPTPESVLGYRLGERFTRYADMRRYLAVLAGGSPRVTVEDYGSTYEGRPLTLVVVTGAGNRARLREIRDERGRLADPEGLGEAERERLVREAPVVVWLGYGVHGNEAASSEAAMATAYVLAAAGSEWAEILDRVVVVLEPLANPDGHERYVAGFEQRRGRRARAEAAAAEHWEPWPGGRQNHYLVDLNRDWAWATQRETRHRLVAYRAWEPQVDVDFHEMSSESSYFFPPTAEPINPEIDRRAVRWLEVFGAANAAAFDRRGWLYYKAESFDLFYPGYGDSYPSFRGAVGMTYEVGGGGRAGEELRLPDGDRLTLADRVARHLTTSLTSVATAAAHRRELLADYVAGRLDRGGRGAAGAERPPATYLWDAGQPEAGAMAALLALHGVRVGRLDRAATLPARPILGTTVPAPTAFPAGAWAVSTAQPLGNLVRTLLEPEMPLPEGFLAEQRRRLEDHLDTEFFDVTAWSLPLAFNVTTWVAPGEAGGTVGDPGSPLRPAGLAALPDPERELPAGGAGRIVGEGDLGYLLPPQGLAGYRAVAHLLAGGARLRVALDGLTTGGRHYPAGTVFIPATAGDDPETDGDPEDPDGAAEADGGEGEVTAGRGDGGGGRLAAAVAAAAGDAGVEVVRVGSSSVEEGISLGSDRFAAVAPPRIGLVGGAPAGTTSFGFLWHLFDRQLELPVTRLDADRLDRIELAAFDVLVLPDGDWGEQVEADAAVLERWTRDGGLLVAVGGAIEWLQKRKLTAVETWGEEKAAAAPAGDDEAPAPTEGETRAQAPDDKPPKISTPGAILATRIERDHPLTAGLPGPPPVLFEGSTVLAPTGDPQRDILTADPDAPVLAGVAWPEARERLAGALLVATEPLDRGRLVLFAQEPDFRLFWRGTAPLLLNAVLYGPSWGVDRRY